jgi:nickel superoxide dismutase
VIAELAECGRIFVMNILNVVSKFLPIKTIYAHCDIPCGIYDPHNMQMAAHTVIRMTQMINDLAEDSDHKKFTHQMARLVKVKEEHGELCKHELRVLWADYFKPEMVEKYPDLHDLVFKTMKLASKGRQEINLEAAEELLANTQRIAEIFFETKGLKSKKVKAPYPTEREIVIQSE